MWTVGMICNKVGDSELYRTREKSLMRMDDNFPTTKQNWQDLLGCIPEGVHLLVQLKIDLYLVYAFYFCVRVCLSLVLGMLIHLGCSACLLLLSNSGSAISCVDASQSPALLHLCSAPRAKIWMAGSACRKENEARARRSSRFFYYFANSFVRGVAPFYIMKHSSSQHSDLPAWSGQKKQAGTQMDVHRKANFHSSSTATPAGIKLRSWCGLWGFEGVEYRDVSSLYP